ncbi:hypothetical protein AVEN_59709-1 [Araneus ventricosus]|uniref:Alpha-latrotoxin n=1 Tax=Araneus ventricosus TaxID=182803 RepID=A0A4Y2BMR5_ARAVE|nr:hypothetical protein AVEN_59709-1 [Araneus ventricosus]
MEEFTEDPLHWHLFSDEFYDKIQSRLEDPNELDDGGYTLLHVAAWSRVGNSRITQLLLERGADVHSTTPHGHTPLHFAVCSRKRDTGVALIEAGASVNSEDFLGRTALHFSVCKRWPHPQSPILHIACDMWIVKRLLCDPGIILNPVDETGETPLMWAVKERNWKAVRALLKKGVNPNIPNEDNRTPLHVALSARNPSYDIVIALLICGAGIYCEDKFRQRESLVGRRHFPLLTPCEK